MFKEPGVIWTPADSGSAGTSGLSLVPGPSLWMRQASDSSHFKSLEPGTELHSQLE